MGRWDEAFTKPCVAELTFGQAAGISQLVRCQKFANGDWLRIIGEQDMLQSVVTGDLYPYPELNMPEWEANVCLRTGQRGVHGSIGGSRSGPTRPVSTGSARNTD